MNVAVYGAGALGSVYGVRLARRAAVEVTFVVRPERLSAPAPDVVIEAIRSGQRESLDGAEVRRSDAIPADADLIVVAVATEVLVALAPRLSTSQVPIVVLTPMLPRDWQAMREAFGDRVHAALPNVIGYTREDGVVRYWVAPAPTKIDEPRAGSPWAEELHAFAQALDQAGLRGRLELGVHESNPATTACFIPIAMAIAAAGSVDALLADDALAALASQACREGVRLGHRLGRPEIWAPLAPWLALPWMIRLWLAGLVRISPEARRYADEHFGRKLVAQHVAMIDAMIELADARGLPRVALAGLGAKLHALR